MTARQIIVVTAVGVAFILLVLELIRRHMMREKYSLLWIVIALAALSVPVLYNVYAWMAGQLGIIEVANFFFYLAIMALFLLSLQFSLALSAAYQRGKVLTQHLGLLESRIRELEGQLGKTPQPPQVPAEPQAGG